MESGKRSKNFTEREKMLLIKVAKEFVAIIDNKKTDGITVEAKKQAWMALTNKYNVVSESGFRTEKQLHALYDNLKKKARKHFSNDKFKSYKSGGGMFCQKQINEAAIINKRLDILKIQHQHELMKLEKTKILLDLDIELKRTLLENAKMDFEFKKNNLNL
ncbi:unnamed protein product [Parnassius mnemosyne]|uniref:Regulatory protein zeste n=1 Tax=Parnassius mnemosyne TaxID=213953 RepID=A0AAV1KU91_9NEOP